VKGTCGQGLLYKFNNLPGTLQIYSDSDFANDVTTRKSISGVVSMYGGCAVTWSSKQQQCVALSTTEAEFIAASEAAREAIWLTKLLSDLTMMSQVPVISIDNQSTIKLVKNPEFHCRTKHIDVKYCFIREKFVDGQIGIAYVPSEQQVADIFTKVIVGKDQYNALKSLLGMKDILSLNDY
jgi:hypothetical protein